MTKRALLRRRSIAMLLVGLVLTATASVRGSAGAEEAADLRGDIPTGDEVRVELSRIATDRIEFVGSLAGLEGDLVAAMEARVALGAEGQRLAAEIEATAAKVRELAVSAFVAPRASGSVASAQ